jgi:PPOX class probable F420-dependent enzyme
MGVCTSRTEEVLDTLRGKKYINITTFRKDGRAVSTPVEFVVKDGAIYIRAREGSGKTKRARINPKVKIGPCTIRGVVTGPCFEGTGTLVEDEGTLYSLFSKKCGFFWRLGTKIRKRTPQPPKIIPRGD